MRWGCLLADHIAAGGGRQAASRGQAVRQLYTLLARAPTAHWPPSQHSRQPSQPPTRCLGGPLALHELRCQPALHLRGREGELLGVQATEHAKQEEQTPSSSHRRRGGST